MGDNKYSMEYHQPSKKIYTCKYIPVCRVLQDGASGNTLSRDAQVLPVVVVVFNCCKVQSEQPGVVLVVVI